VEGKLGEAKKESPWNSSQISIIYNLFTSDICAVDFSFIALQNYGQNKHIEFSFTFSYNVCW